MTLIPSTNPSGENKMITIIIICLCHSAGPLCKLTIMVVQYYSCPHLLLVWTMWCVRTYSLIPLVSLTDPGMSEAKLSVSGTIDFATYSEHGES